MTVIGGSRWIVILVGAVFLSSGHAQEREGKPPASLLVYPKSENVRYKQRSGAWWAYYDVHVEYPAEEVLNFIRRGLEQQGWQPMKEDALNPGVPSSHVAGWRDFADGRTSPKTQVHQWLAQWKNPQGDEVWFTLRYQHPKGSAPIPKELTVVATYVPARIVEQQLRWVEQDRAQKQK